jgi:hypothetical protein
LQLRCVRLKGVEGFRLETVELRKSPHLAQSLPLLCVPDAIALDQPAEAGVPKRNVDA